MADVPVKIGFCTYVLYYAVLFFAHWFGAHRFDYDKDGDFDPEDVHKYLANRVSLVRNYQRQVRLKAVVPPYTPTIQPFQNAQKKEFSMVPSKSTRADVTRLPTEHATVCAANPTGVKTYTTYEGADVKAFATGKSTVWWTDTSRQCYPWFVSAQCIVCLLAWLIAVLVDLQDCFSGKAGLDSISPGNTDLRWSSGDCKTHELEIWRWITYQFTHVGISHVAINIFMTLMLGIPLEGFHGTLRVALLFEAGVVGGAISYYLNDAHSIVVGASAGVYALVGVHFADLILNWTQKPFRIPKLVLLLLLVCAEIISFLCVMSPINRSQWAHLGGALAGLIIGIAVCRNLEVQRHERFLIASAASIAIVIVGLTILWIGINGAPKNIWEALQDHPGYCWYGQAYVPSIQKSKILCIRCDSEECVERVRSISEFVKPVRYKTCADYGWHVP